MKRIQDRSLDTALWAGQWILAIAFELSGMIKLGLHVHHVRAHFGLAAETTSSTLHAVGLGEVIISMLAVLPALTRLFPQLSTAAAAALGAIALVGTASPATAAGTGVAMANLALASLAALVVWGRLKAPVAPFDDEAGAATDDAGDFVLPSTRTPPEAALPALASGLSMGQVPSHP